jgi:hypothetical protein
MPEPIKAVHSFAEGGPLALPARNIKADDFNYLMSRFQATSFHAPGSDHYVHIFNSSQYVANGFGRESNSQFLVPQPIFLSNGHQAAQLFMNLRVGGETDCTFFTVRGDGPLPRSGIEVTRDFDDLTVAMRLQNGDTLKRSYSKIENIDTSKLSYSPYPAVPRVLLRHDELGYVCFAFERYACHPSIQGKYPKGVDIRCFYGDSSGWKEADVTSVVRGGRGTGNLTFHTEIGGFFVPGPNSCGSCQYTPPGGSTVDCDEYEIASVADALNLNSQANLDAFRALRRLGLPPVWPPPELI